MYIFHQLIAFLSFSCALKGVTRRAFFSFVVYQKTVKPGFAALRYSPHGAGHWRTGHARGRVLKYKTMTSLAATLLLLAGMTDVKLMLMKCDDVISTSIWRCLHNVTSTSIRFSRNHVASTSL